MVWGVFGTWWWWSLGGLFCFEFMWFVFGDVGVLWLYLEVLAYVLGWVYCG